MSTRISVRDATRIVARHWGVSVAKLQARGKVRRYSVPRQIAYWIAVRHGGETYSNTADYFGRHHTSVIGGLLSIERRMSTDPDLARRAADAAAAAAVVGQRGIDLVTVASVGPLPVAASFPFVDPAARLDRYRIRIS